MAGNLTKQPRTVFAFACRVANVERWGETIYNAHTAGAAKEQHWRHVSDAWDGTSTRTSVPARSVLRIPVSSSSTTPAIAACRTFAAGSGSGRTAVTE